MGVAYLVEFPEFSVRFLHFPFLTITFQEEIWEFYHNAIFWNLIPSILTLSGLGVFFIDLGI